MVVGMLSVETLQCKCALVEEVLQRFEGRFLKAQATNTNHAPCPPAP